MVATKHYGPGAFELSPMVGVSVSEVERLVMSHETLASLGVPTPTVTRPLGHLMPEKRFRAWEFPAEDNDVAVAEMVDAIEKFGIPFIVSLGSLALVREKLDSDLKSPSARHRRPAAALVAGDLECAKRILAEEVQKATAKPDGSTVAYLAFAERLMALIREREMQSGGK